MNQADHNIISALFDSLQAESEGQWLSSVFVPPTIFSVCTSNRSVVVLGTSGSGKTALQAMLLHHRATQTPAHFTVQWNPMVQPHLSGTPASQALRACLRELLVLAGRYPERWRNAPDWMIQTVRWLLHRLLPELQQVPDYYLSRLAENATETGVALQASLIREASQPIFQTDVREEQLIGELIGIVQRLGYADLWLMVDGLERLAEQSPDELGKVLQAFFSTLTIFEHPHIAIKMMAPMTLASMIRVSGGVIRRRIDAYELQWTPQELETILTHRLALAIRRPSLTLSEIYDQDAVRRWLFEHGQNSPREWLFLGRQLLEQYRAGGAELPLSDADWDRLIQPERVILSIDTDQGLVSINKKHMHLSPASYKLLTYLYQHQDRICTRAELY